MAQFSKYETGRFVVEDHKLGSLAGNGELATFSVQVDPSKVVWNDEKHMVLETAEDVAYQAYERVEGTDDWERLPRGGVVIFKTAEAARKAVEDGSVL